MGTYIVNSLVCPGTEQWHEILGSIGGHQQ